MQRREQQKPEDNFARLHSILSDEAGQSMDNSKPRASKKKGSKPQRTENSSKGNRRRHRHHKSKARWPWAELVQDNYADIPRTSRSSVHAPESGEAEVRTAQSMAIEANVEPNRAPTSERSNTDTQEVEFIAYATDLELVCRYYIGHKTRSTAEKVVRNVRPDTFYLYHRLPEGRGLDNLGGSVQLHVLYVGPQHEIRHFPVLKRNFSDRSMYSVDCGGAYMPFESLTRLVRFFAQHKAFPGNNGFKQTFPSS